MNEESALVARFACTGPAIGDAARLRIDAPVPLFDAFAGNRNGGFLGESERIAITGRALRRTLDAIRGLPETIT